MIVRNSPLKTEDETCCLVWYGDFQICVKIIVMMMTALHQCSPGKLLLVEGEERKWLLTVYCSAE